MSNSATKKKYDVVIVGGGMVGTALACALGDSQLSVAIIETNRPNHDWPNDSFDLRVSAITRASQHFLESLGVWQNMTDERTCAYHDMHVWDAGGNGSIHFDCADIGEANLGHIVENRIISKALTQRARQFDNIRYHCPNSPHTLQFNNHSVKLELDDGTQIETELLVGSDGGQSWVRQHAGIVVNTRDYQQTAVVANVTTELSHQHTAWQRFLPTGPLAFLPLSEQNISSIVWSTSPEEAERLIELDEDEFNQELEAAFESKLGKIIHSGPRASFPIKGQHAKNYVQPHLALVGDAAHTIHPLAGQGVNLGFADVQCLAGVIHNAHSASKSIGSYKTLRRYERARRGENAIMLEAMGAFKQLFSNNTPGIRELRSTGLQLTDRLLPIKHFFMTKALG